MSTKNTGTKATASTVEASIPENTVTPIDLRADAPAPLAAIKGTTPRMKANEVIKMGRNLRRVPSSAAFSRLMPPDRNSSLATSTMRMAFLADIAISSTRPICT